LLKHNNYYTRVRWSTPYLTRIAALWLTHSNSRHKVNQAQNI